MAKRYEIAPQVVDSIETYINYTIDGLIEQLNVRRAQLLQQVRKIREDKQTAMTTQFKMILELTQTKAELEQKIKENRLLTIQTKMVKEIEKNLQDLRDNFPGEIRLKWQCDTRDLDTSIFRLGEIVQTSVGVPQYAAFKMSNVTTAKKGSGPAQLRNPFGAAIHEARNQIFIANSNNDRVEIFSHTGEYLNQLGVGQLNCPYGVAIHGENVYVSCLLESTVSQFRLTDMSLVRKIGGKGSNNGQFDNPRQLKTDPIGHVFIADTNNNRISVHDKDLNHLRNISHKSMSEPVDVEVSRDRVYVLSPTNNPCMHVLTLEGDKLHSLIARGQGMDVQDPWFFCIDQHDNFVITDSSTHSIRVFSPEGNLLHTIGKEGHQQGMFYQPRGITITPELKLICVSRNENYRLQIYY